MPAPSVRRKLALPVPTTILTGALASGKTTAIASLLQSKPPHEVWAVLINEFGAAGLDAALLEGGAAAPSPLSSPPAAADQQRQQRQQQGPSAEGGVHIKQLAGGCLCCALSSVTSLAIAQLLRNVKPDRLLIEPSGLAHPAQLLDMLQGGHLASSLALQPVVCLVDATQFSGGRSAPACCDSQLLLDQISIADVVVGSKADLCDELALHAFHLWAQQLYPPKLLVATAQQGRVDPGTAAAAALLAWPATGGGDGGSSGGGSSSYPGSCQQEEQQEPRQQQPQQENGDSSASCAPAAAAGIGAIYEAYSQQQLPLQRPRRVAAAGSPWLSSSGDGSGGSSGSRSGGDTASPAAGGCEVQALPSAERQQQQDQQHERKHVLDPGGSHAACGWIFPRDRVFNRQRLLELLQHLVPATLRVKGVLRVTHKSWVAVSAAPGPLSQPGAAAAMGVAAGASATEAAAAVAAVELRETAYRRDSRIEVIVDTAAAAAAAAAATGGSSSSSGGGCGGGLEQQAAGLSLHEPAGSAVDLARQVPAAVGRAAHGEWAALEALILATLQPEHAGGP